MSEQNFYLELVSKMTVKLGPEEEIQLDTNVIKNNGVTDENSRFVSTLSTKYGLGHIILICTVSFSSKNPISKPSTYPTIETLRVLFV